MTITGAIPKPRTFNADLTHLPPALLPLTKLKRWVVWRWEKRVKKNGVEEWTKPPYQCRYPNEPAKSNDPSTWDTYETTLAVVTAGLADGIGFMLKDSEVAAADLDHARDAQTGELIDWAKQLCVEADGFGLYREVTVSGCGLRFIGMSQRGELHRKFTFNRKSGAGIELYRSCTRYITISGLQEGACDQFGSIDDYLDTLLARFDGQPTTAVNSNILDFNDAGPQQPAVDYQDLIENGALEGERSEKFNQVVWHLARQGYTPEQIAEKLSKHPSGIGAKYAGRLLPEIQRSYQKFQINGRAGASGGPGVGAGAGTSAAPNNIWPTIYLHPGEIPRVVNEGEDALLLLDAEVYRLGDMLVEPQFEVIKASGGREFPIWRLAQVTVPNMVELFSRAARWMKFDKRSNAYVQTTVSNQICQTYLDRKKKRVPRIAGIGNTPFLRPNGTLCHHEGYDLATGILCKWDAAFLPDPIPNSLTQADALDALKDLEEPLAEFPFVSPADKSVALSAILTALDRKGMDVAPIHAFTAPTAGTGKGLLIDVAAVIATGSPIASENQGHNEEEQEKRLGASLMDGRSLIGIDNCTRPLEGAFLNSMVTQAIVDVRVLGKSRKVKCPNIALIFANGNNLIVGADTTRRVVICSMDAGVERPEQRKFRDNRLLETVRANRVRLVLAGLTVLRAWHMAREGAGIDLDPMDFVEWTERVRKTLVWLGRADPGATTQRVREDDPYRLERSTVFLEWHRVLDNRSVLVREIIAAAFGDPDLYAALLTVASTRNGKEISPERLGKWLSRNKDTVADDLRLIRVAVSKGYSTWQVQTV